MAANEDDASEPGSAMRSAMLTAGVVGLDDVASETVSLVLEILGWSVAAAASIKALPDQPYRLVFIDELIFRQSLLHLTPVYVKWGNVVLVGPPSITTIVSIKDSKILRADLPLDVAHLESIVSNVIQSSIW